MVTRRAALLAAAGVLAGCASEDRAPPAAAAPGGILTPLLAINGGWRTASLVPVPVQPPRPMQRVMLLHPVGVAARGEVVVIADAGTGTLWRYDRTRDALVALAPFSGAAADHGVSVQIDADYSVWVALPAEHAVVQFDAQGRPARRLRDDVDAPRPVAVALDTERGDVLVADAADARIVAFDRFGLAHRFHERDPQLQSIAAIAWGPQGLYVLDRAAQQVVVLDRRGVPVALAGDEHLVHPRALAVDRAGRVFIADEADQQIKVYRGRDLIGRYGGPAQFGRIEALALDGSLLYAADSVNARVQVMLVAPPSLETP